MTLLLSVVDGVAEAFGWLAKLTILILVGSMMYEVAARYLFAAPTLWAFDISYMLNGAIFLLGAALTLKADAHVRIDFLSQRLPRRLQRAWHALVYLLVLTPLFTAFAWIAGGKAWTAYVTGEVESVSPWAPLVWPFYGALAAGLAAAALQFLAEGLKYADGRATPGAHAAENELEGVDASPAVGREP